MLSKKINDLSKFSMDVDYLLELMAKFGEEDEENINILTPVYCVFFETMTELFQKNMEQLGKTDSEYKKRYNDLKKLMPEIEN